MKPKYQIGKLVFFFKRHHVAKDWMGGGRIHQITLDGRSKKILYWLEGEPHCFEESDLYGGAGAICKDKVKELKEDIKSFQEVLENLQDVLKKGKERKHEEQEKV